MENESPDREKAVQPQIPIPNFLSEIHVVLNEKLQPPSADGPRQPIGNVPMDSFRPVSARGTLNDRIERDDVMYRGLIFLGFIWAGRITVSGGKCDPIVADVDNPREEAAVDNFDS